MRLAPNPKSYVNGILYASSRKVLTTQNSPPVALFRRATNIGPSCHALGDFVVDCDTLDAELLRLTDRFTDAL